MPNNTNFHDAEASPTTMKMEVDMLEATSLVASSMSTSLSLSPFYHQSCAVLFRERKWTSGHFIFNNTEQRPGLNTKKTDNLNNKKAQVRSLCQRKTD
jgi:hypothetical protein